MSVLAEAIRLGQHALQTQLDKLMAAVFGRVVDAKEPVRREAMTVLSSASCFWKNKLGRHKIYPNFGVTLESNTTSSTVIELGLLGVGLHHNGINPYTGFANNLHGDVVLSTLTRCLDLVKAVKARQAVLEHCSTTAGQICATASPVAIR